MGGEILYSGAGKKGNMGEKSCIPEQLRKIRWGRDPVYGSR